jgi:hypothetical protein
MSCQVRSRSDRVYHRSMRRLALVAALVLALPQLATAAPLPRAPAGCGDCSPFREGYASVGLARSTWLVWATTVNTAFTAFDVYQLARGRGRNYKVTGLQMVMALPVAVYGFDYVRSDSSDYVAWGLSLWSAGLVVHGFWPFIADKFKRDDVDAKPSSFHVGPTLIVGWGDEKPRAGLSISGTF